ncbi:hypothetical protein J2W47_000112 [Priestia megaterium]|nr:hypothetical protein [Priestia megaterium]
MEFLTAVAVTISILSLAWIAGQREQQDDQ